MLVTALCRTTLYKQFDRLLLVGIGFYGIFAYATRNSTPLLMAELDVALSWRWMYWSHVPIALVGMMLVWRYFRPDRPPQPIRLPIDWLALTLFVAWIVAIVFAFGWYRKWGGWTSNAFAVTVILCITLPVILGVWLGSGFSPDEHLKRLVRSRIFVLAMMTRGLMLTQLVGVLTIVGMYATGLRDYPRITAGWLMVPATLTMASSTFLTTWLHRRGLRHVWLVVGVVGAAACIGWLSALDNFTAKEHVAVILACWGAFLGLFPPAFLTDEIEGLNPKDFLYAGTLAVVGLVVPLLTVPTATGTMVKAWSDRAGHLPPQPEQQPSACVGGRGSRRRVLSAARPEWAGPSARDRHGPGHLRHGRERRRGVPVGPALPEPDDADPRADGCFATVAGGTGLACAARGRLYLSLLASPRLTAGGGEGTTVPPWERAEGRWLMFQPAWQNNCHRNECTVRQPAGHAPLNPRRGPPHAIPLDKQGENRLTRTLSTRPVHGILSAVTSSK